MLSSEEHPVVALLQFQVENYGLQLSFPSLISANLDASSLIGYHVAARRGIRVWHARACLSQRAANFALRITVS